MKKTKTLLFGLMLILGSHLLGQTSYVQLGSDINGTASDAFGSSVASSSDGSIIAIGATSAPGGILIGQVKVFELSGTSWIQKGSTLSGQFNGDSYGTGLSISGNGLVLAVGSPHSQSNFTEFSNSGRVYLYEWNGSSWIGIDTLDASAEQENFGTVLSLSENGNILAVGLPGAAGGGVMRGASRVYKRVANNWSQIGSDINGIQNFETFGNSISVAITASDSVLAVGAPLNSLVGGANDDAGKVHIYRSSTGTWGGTWTATDSIKGTAYDYLGFSVSLSSDGSRLLVGAPQSFLNPGTAYAQVYEYGSNWTPLGGAISSNLFADELGKSVALSGDGTHVLVGAPAFSPNSYVKLYKLEIANWILQDSLGSTASDDAYGAAVAINNDGSKFFVGAPINNDAGDVAGQVKAYHPFVPDFTKPSATLSTTEPEYTSTNPLPITITFTEEVSGFVVGDITVGNGSASNLATSDSMVFTADITPLADGQVSIDIAAGVCSDLADNANEASTQLVINYDITEPSVVITTASDTTNLNPTQVTITFSEKVSGFSSDDLTISNGNAANLFTSDSITFTIDITHNSEDVDKLNIAANMVTDLSGKGNTAAVEYNIFYDTTKASVFLNDQILSVNTLNTFTYSLYFSEKVVGFELGDISVTNATVSNLQFLGEFPFGNSVLVGYTVAITPNGNGDITINVGVGTVHDVAGNENIAATQVTVKFDITSPTVAISTSTGNPSNANPLPITITFSEKVGGFVASDITVVNGSVSSLATSDSIEFTAEIIPVTNGILTIDIAEGVTHDFAGNINTATSQFTIGIDLTAPTVAITSALSGSTNTSPINITLTFNEKVSGFAAADIVVGNATVTNLQTADSINFTADITPTADGIVSIDVAENMAHDSAGNGNTLATQLSFIYDKTAPIATISNAPKAINNTNFNIAISFGEEVTGMELTDIHVVNGTVSNLITASNIYQVTISPSGVGNITIDVPANGTHDLAGNSNAAASQVVVTYDATAPVVAFNTLATTDNTPVLTGTVNDTTASVVVKIGGISYSATTNKDFTWTLPDGTITTAFADGIYDVTVIASDAAQNADTVKSIGALTIDVTDPVVTITSLITNDATPELKGTVQDATAGVASVEVTVNNAAYTATINGLNWTALVSTAIPEGNYDVTVTATDNVGNIGTDSSTDDLTIDLTAPTVVITALAETKKEPFSITITFSEEVSGFELTDLTVGNATASNFANTITKTYTVDITPNTNLNKGDLITINISANGAQDAAGNANTAALEVKVIFTQKYSGGSGTEADPYLIGNEADLRAISGNTGDYSAHFKQIANIEMGAETYTPIGKVSMPFRGTYDGQAYVIDGLMNLEIADVIYFLDIPLSGSGLFGTIKDAMLKNMGLTSVNFTLNSGALGGLVGAAESSTIENCFITGSSYANVGGATLLGYGSSNDIINNCFSDLNIYGNSQIKGGLIVEPFGNFEINNCYSLSNIITDLGSTINVDKGGVGGLIGFYNHFSSNDSKINNSYYAGQISGYTGRVGGLVGFNNSTDVNTINGSFWDKELSGIETDALGGSGLNSAEMKNLTTYINAGWDISSIFDNKETVWKYAFSYPIFKWQLDKQQDFSISGRVVDENGMVFTAGTVKAIDKNFNESGSVTLDAEGKFSLNLAKGTHLIYVVPTNTDKYMQTYYGNTNNGFKSKIAMYNNSGVEIKMIAKSQANLLDGQGRVSGRVVKSGKKAAEIVQGKVLEGEPLAGITVFLVRVSDGEIMTSVVSDENGDFEITGIPAGEYQLMLDVVGIDANLEGSTFTMDEEGTPLVISAVVGTEGITFGIEDAVGIEDQIALTIYPNPATKFVNVQVSGKASVRVIDIRGSVVTEKVFTDKIHLDVAFLKENLYFLEIRSEKGVAIRKLIKNN